MAHMQTFTEQNQCTMSLVGLDTAMMPDGGPRKRPADTEGDKAEGGQAAEGSSAKRSKPDATDTASAYTAAILLVRNGE
jgi:hypothetical protein